MRPLVIDEKARKSVAETISFAEKNRFSRPYMAELMAGKGTPPGDLEGHCCYFFNGFKSVFSIEEQPVGWCRHLSVSVAAMDKMPHVEAVKLIMKEFGFEQSLEDCYVYVEDSSPKAINIISKI